MRAKNKLSKIRVGKIIKYIVFSTNILATIILILSVLAWYVVPSKITFIAYLGLGFPIVLFVNILYLLLWVITFRWKYALIQFVAIALCWSPIFTYFPIHFKTSEKNIPENHIKVLSYNVCAFNWKRGDAAKKNPILKYLTESKADIICLQEYAVSSMKNNKGIISEEEIKTILKDYPYSQVVKLKASHGNLTYGLACFSKFPIEKTEHIPLESSYNGAVMYQLKINDKKVTLINNHLESNRITAEDKKLYRDFVKARDKDMISEVAENVQTRLGAAYTKRETQADAIRTLIDKQKTDVTIVCGDFNDTPISYVYHTIKGDLVDSFTNTGFGQGITYHENKFWFRIDFIMHSRNIQSYNCTVDKVKYSDHYPIWTYLTFK